MTKEEKLAFEYGKNAANMNIQYAPCYDCNMKSLVSEARSESGSIRNQRNMRAWYEGYLEQCESIGGEAAALARKTFDRLFAQPDGPEQYHGQTMNM